MTKEYIERETAKSELLSWAVCMNHPEYLMRDDAMHVIDSIPAADVKPVVRCWECKHHYWVQEPCHGKSVHYCKLPHMRGIEIFKEFFCYYGERKEGSDNG